MFYFQVATANERPIGLSHREEGSTRHAHLCLLSEFNDRVSAILAHFLLFGIHLKYIVFLKYEFRGFHQVLFAVWIQDQSTLVNAKN